MKFSIVTITNNRAHIIEATIQSVLSQSYSNFEHIIIDDGSTDNTKEIIDSFGDDRIKYFFYNKQKKRSYLRNEGLKKVTGDIICILDSDDIWMPKKLAVLQKIFSTKEDVSIVFHHVIEINQSQVEKMLYTYTESNYLNGTEEMLQNNLLPFPFYSFKKEIIHMVGYYDEKAIDGQQDFLFRISMQHLFYFCDKILSSKKQHKENLSQSKQINQLIDYKNSIDKLKKYNHINTKQYKNTLQEINFKIARAYINKGNKKSAHLYIYSSLKNTPFFSLNYLRTLLLLLKK